MEISNSTEVAQTQSKKASWLDIIFSGQKWYRKRKGGTWCLIKPLSFPEISVWVQEPKERFEKIESVEYYITQIPK